MGDPKRIKRKYETPSHPWQAERIQEEKKLQSEYGLRNKQEIWKAQAMLRGFSRQARELLAQMSDQSKRQERQLLGKLVRLNILKEGSTLDNVLSLNVRDVLNRRLQTLVYKKGLSNTVKQARQFIVHGHITINERKVNSPGYMVTGSEEEKIEGVEDSVAVAVKIQAKDDKNAEEAA
ncbi:MAG TPA: 30S ribosomal protein S4 [Euryarchaeota archaeon]|nr:30S ribosomal protein S4 [archaeon BMS3Bbin15]HDL15075.1 30S ribosomal protein S4 [Euryarchaeota archaeon]